MKEAPSEPGRTQATPSSASAAMQFWRKVWGCGAAGSEVPPRVLEDGVVHEIKVRSIDRGDSFRQKPIE